ncbi:hypothetical protein [Actinoplanes sp. NBRC 103695]|uniref:hypothetical protein n=1 Tax=Actinoplanes sp. NBRC 103695 TaxID=3032202 RepID=UPI0024A0709C|nr:hypothetical protein [Actinoplanes sp. NBRC 103695]GLZ01357.1 hypothetical protein Acsp02_86080 [Actinoplanes sp. NBRC 103695]
MRTQSAAVPVAQAYSGHQFGGFSPRLGDGAGSHLRVGSFQYARATGDVDLLRRLEDHAISRHSRRPVRLRRPAGGGRVESRQACRGDPSLLHNDDEQAVALDVRALEGLQAGE